MAEPNPSANLFGSGGSDGIASKATSSIRNMNTAAQQLVTQLRMARDLVSQMKRDSDAIAKNLSGIKGGGFGGGGGGGGGRGGGGGGNGSGNTGSSGNNLLRQPMFSALGGMAAQAFGRGMQSLGNNLLEMSDRAYTIRQWNPGTFSSQGAALRGMMPNIPIGRNALDASSSYQLYGYGLGGSNFTAANNSAAFMGRLGNMSASDAMQGAGQFYNIQTSMALRRNLGIYTRNPSSMQMMDPSQITSAILSRGTFHGTADQKVNELLFSLRSGGGADVTLRNNGISGNAKDMFVAQAIYQLRTGKDPSKMTADEKNAALNSPEYRTWRSAQAERSTAAAGAQYGAVDSADTSYQAVAGAQTAILSHMDGTLMSILGALTGGGAAMGLGGGATSGLVGNLLGSYLGSRGAGLAMRGIGGGVRGIGGSVLGAAGGAGGLARIGAGAAGAVGVGLVGSKLRSVLEGLGGGVHNTDKDPSSVLRRLGSGAFEVGQNAAQGASIGAGFAGGLGALVGGTIGTVWGAGKTLWDVKQQGWDYGSLEQDDPGGNWQQSIVSGQTTEAGGSAAPAKKGSGSSGAASGGVIAEAMKWIGTPYSWGGGNLSGPSRGQAQGAKTVGFDCSSFVQYVFHKFGVNLPRTSQQQAKAGKEVPRNQAAKGDLLIFTFTDTNGHVAIYLGGNKMIHAPHTGTSIKIAGVPWGSVTHIRRVIGSALVGNADGSPGAGNTNLATSDTGTSVGSSSGGIYFNGHGAQYYSGQGGGGGGTPASTAAAAGNSLTGAAVSAPKGKAAPAGTVKTWIDQAMKILGKDPSKFEYGLYNMIMHESSGNPHAVNASYTAGGGHPSGLMQTLPDTFRANMLKGHGNIWNPIDNIIAGFRYAERRYGDAMIAAGGNKDKHGGYAAYSEGAWRINKDQDARIHEGEMILPKAMAESMRTAIREGFSGSKAIGGAGVVVNMNVTINGASEQQAMQMVRKFQQTVSQAQSVATIRRR